jgi:hypothetical protein
MMDSSKLANFRFCRLLSIFLAKAGFNLTQAVHQAEVSLSHFVCVKDESRPDSSGVYNTYA